MSKSNLLENLPNDTTAAYGGEDILKHLNNLASAGHKFLVMAIVPTAPEGEGDFGVIMCSDYVNTDDAALKSDATNAELEFGERFAPTIMASTRAVMLSAADALNTAYANGNAALVMEMIKTADAQRSYGSSTPTSVH